MNDLEKKFDMKKNSDEVMALVKRATGTAASSSALHYSQAALNVANALRTLADIPPQHEGKV